MFLLIYRSSRLTLVPDPDSNILDRKHETVILPIFGIPAPFHISMIKVSFILYSTFTIRLRQTD